MYQLWEKEVGWTCFDGTERLNGLKWDKHIKGYIVVYIGREILKGLVVVGQ